jgi:uncharacterized membrane protein (DUF4010 family)
LTTAATVFAVSLASILIGSGKYFEAVAVGVVIALLLSEKRLFQTYVDRFSQAELVEALQFIFLAAVLLPLTPDETFLGFVNPRTVLVLVVAILSIQFLSFVALRLYGRRGFHLSALLGGTVNSTATVLSIASHSTEGDVAVADDGVMLAVAGSLIRNWVVVAVFSTSVAFSLLPAFAAAVAVAFASYYLLDTGRHDEVDFGVSSPFSFRSAFTFGGLFLVLLAVIHYLQAWFGDVGFLASSVAGGAASSLSVIASAISLLDSGGVTVQQAGLGVVLAVTGSFVAKLVLLFARARDLYWRVFLPLVSTGAALGAVFLLL